MAFDPTKSIVDYLSSVGEDNSFSARKKIAEELGIENYKGTKEQNIEILASYQGNQGTPEEVEKEVQKALSKNDMATLKEAIAKYGKDVVIEKLKADPNYDEIKARLEESLLRKNELEDKAVSDRSGTDKIIEEKGPKETIFPQYKPFEVSDEERKNIEATQKAYYDPYYERETSRLTEGYETDKLALDRLIGYSKTDTARDLAKTNTTFAKSMSKASQVYGQRNILGSGIQKQQAGEETSTLEKDIYNREEYARRTEEGYETRQANIKTTFQEGLTGIEESQQAQTYFDTLKEIQNRQDEYTRQFGQSQENVDFNLTKPTTPTPTTYTGTDANKKVLNSNYR